MKVEHSSGDAYPSQTCKAYSTGKVYRRIFSSNQWGKWSAFSDDDTILNGRGNTLKANNTVPSVYGESFQLCYITLETYSTYLVVGGVSCDSSLDEQMSCVIHLIGDHDATFFGITNTRTSGKYGGGTVNVALVVTASKKARLSLDSFGYSNSEYNAEGRLFAVKLA